MSDLHKAAQKALMAMDDMATNAHILLTAASRQHEFEEARDSLRAALAQQDVAEAACGNMEQQEAEPVGVVTGKLGTRVSLDAPTLRKGDKVYAAPLARKPLSQEQIKGAVIDDPFGGAALMSMMRDGVMVGELLQAIERIARAVEKAHGIGGGDE